MDAPEQPNVLFLNDGGQTERQVCDRLVEYINGAQHHLELAIYDAHLTQPYDDAIFAAFAAAEGRGVQIRAVFNQLQTGDDGQPHVPKTSKGMPQTGPSLLQRLIASHPFKGIPGEPDLMHHKYVIRDRKSVWTGSLNWTDDAWTRQENAVIIVPGTDLAAAFLTDFNQLWASGEVEHSGKLIDQPAQLTYKKRPLSVRALFSPAAGEQISALIGRRIGQAKHRLHICSPVITAAPVLHALIAQIESPTVLEPITIAIDGPQVENAMRQWRNNPQSKWKLPLLEKILASGHVAKKPSTPYAPGAVHDYMHAKMVICDDTVITGSFNCSRSGEMNAENVLEIVSTPMADEFSEYAKSVHRRYFQQ